MTSSVAIIESDKTAWRDAEFAPRMVDLPAGEFFMGENFDDKFANDTERPAHRVRIAAGSALGQFPVTLGQFRRFRPAWPDGDDDLPAVNVTWRDAVAYCDWLTAETRRKYRLPSEAEWEFACRAGSQSPFCFGDEITPSLANYLYDESGIAVGIGGRSAVGRFPANRFGFHDLHGNVCEWVGDNWRANYFAAGDEGGAWSEPGSRRRVIRGGAWDYLPRLLRSAWRDWRDEESHADNLGFRVAAISEP